MSTMELVPLHFANRSRMLYMPESPRYLMHKGRPVDAFRVWKRIRGVSSLDSREEFFVMKVSTEEEEEEVRRGRSSKYPWMDFIRVPRARRAIVYANVMIFLGQFTGINAIMYYMSVLYVYCEFSNPLYLLTKHSMKQLGFNSYEANYMSLVGGGSLLLGTIPAIFLMEKCGRRFWAIAMLPGFFIGLLLCGVSSYVPSLNGQTGVYLSGIIIYEAFFGSYATLTWLVVLPHSTV